MPNWRPRGRCWASTRRVSELADERAGHPAPSGRHASHVRPQRHRELHHLQVRVGVRCARSRRPVPRSRPVAFDRQRRLLPAELAIGIVPLFETIADLQGASDDRRCVVVASALSASGSTSAVACRRSCSATPTATRMAAISPRTGRCTAARRAWSKSPSVTACSCACSTVAAAPSAAAGARATTRSLRNPPAVCRWACG